MSSVSTTASLLFTLLVFGVLGDQLHELLGDQLPDPQGPPVLLAPLLLPEFDLWCQGFLAEK